MKEQTYYFHYAIKLDANTNILNSYSALPPYYE